MKIKIEDVRGNNFADAPEEVTIERERAFEAPLQLSSGVTELLHQHPDGFRVVLLHVHRLSLFSQR